jgi:hypothetical protein
MTQPGQAVKQGPHERGTAMEAPGEATRAEPARKIPLFVQELVGPLAVAAEIQGSDQGYGQNLRVAHPALRVFPILERLQQIITEAINEYNLGVYRGSSPVDVQ